ncbi:MAG: AI-2E family transporter [Fimbriimonadaceae bacterium]|nr:AI-2E family transporter [Fimbriimonadaceae bacterium]
MPSWRLGLWAILVVVTVWFLFLVRGILLPFLVGWLIAVILEGPVRWLQLRGFPKWAAVTTLVVSFFLVATLALIRVSPIVAGQILGVRDNLQKVTSGLTEGDLRSNTFTNWSPVVRTAPAGPYAFVDDLLEKYGSNLRQVGLPSTRQALVDQYVEPQREQIIKVVQNFFNGFFGILAGAASSVLLLGLSPIVAFYFLNDMDHFRRRTAQLIPPSIRSQTVGLLGEVGEVFRGYLRGISTVVFLYILATGFLLGILGAPYYILIATIAGVLYLVPIFGSLISTVLVLIVVGFSGQTGPGWFDAGNPWLYAVIVAGAFNILSSFLFDQIITARVMGRAVDLHPLIALFVVSAAGALFGVPGMLVAFPVAGSMKVIFDRLIRVANQPVPVAAGLPAVPMRHRSNF